ncbi:conserved hypothetical protein [Plantibacter sp. T3]|nr:conserved hypothetical protein [Plantibacter sp. T3]
MGSDMSIVTLAQLNGPMWAVDGRTVEVPAGQHPARTVLEAVPAAGGTVVELNVRPTGQEPFTLTLGADGAVTTNALTDPRILHWLRPAQARPATGGGAAEPGWHLFGAHHGSGVSTWTELLDGVELADPGSYSGRLLVVARTTLQGVEAAKKLTHRAGAVLMVPDAPGALPADVRRGIKVLSGVAPIVRAPWIPALRGTLTVSHTPAVAKAAAKTAAGIRSTWKDTP